MSEMKWKSIPVEELRPAGYNPRKKLKAGDKEYEKIVQETYAYADQIITVTTPNSERTLKAYDLAMVVKEYHPNVTVADSLEEAIEMSYLLSTRQSVIICFGSLSFLGEVKKIMKKRN